MPAGVTIKCKRKAGAFVNGELAAAEWGLDVTGPQWYFSINGSTVNTLSAGGGASDLDALTDVVLSSPADSNLLIFDSTTGKWINQTAAQAGLVTADELGVTVATLSSGKVPLSQLPDTIIGAVEYQGAWNANTNSPNLSALSPSKGDYYVVSVAGATSLGGITDWKVGDWAIYNGTAWEKVDNTDAITSVFGRQGTVIAQPSDYDASQVDNDSGVVGSSVADALNTLSSVKANSTHTHDAVDVNAGNLATARMQGNVVAAIQAGGGGTISNSSLVIDGGTI